MDILTLKFYCEQWALSGHHLIASTPTSQIFLVSREGQSAVLKVFTEKGRQFESKGALVLRIFAGNGAVKLLEADEGAHLLEFVGGESLRPLVMAGRDDFATQIAAEVLGKLHSATGAIPGELISMRRNFSRLFQLAGCKGVDPIFEEGAEVAEGLLASERKIRVLHGDIHHENILQSNERGWLAIDPQCLVGEPAYDVANWFYNPLGWEIEAANPGRIEMCLSVFTSALGLERDRVLDYAFTYGCLSAAWRKEDGLPEDGRLAIARAIRSMR